MAEKRYKTTNASEEEKKEFMKELNTLAKKYSFYIEAVPEYIPKEGQVLSEGNPRVFETTARLLVQKIVEVTEEGIPSTNSEVNPLAKDENTPTA